MQALDLQSTLVDSGGGGMVTVDYPAPMDPTLIGPTSLNTAPPTLPPPTPIDNYGTGYPVPGNQVTQPPATMDTVPNQVTLTATGPLTTPVNLPAAPLPAPSSFPWLLVLGVVGGTYLLNKTGTRRAGMLGAKKGSMLVPVVVVGGIAAWYLLGKKQAATTTVTPAPVPGMPGGPSGGGGAAPPDTTTVDGQRYWLQTGFKATNAPNEATFLAAVAQMTPDEVTSMYNILQYTLVPGFNGVLPPALQNAWDFIRVKYNIPGL